MTRIDFLSQLSSAIVEAILPEGQHLDLTLQDIQGMHDTISAICQVATSIVAPELAAPLVTHGPIAWGSKPPPIVWKPAPSYQQGGCGVHIGGGHTDKDLDALQAIIERYAETSATEQARDIIARLRRHLQERT